MAFEGLSEKLQGVFKKLKGKGVLTEADINEAMALKNKVLHLNRADVKLPKGSFFLADIVGAKVVTEDGAELGELADVLELPAGNVYVVKGEREILIPAVEDFILRTDAAAGVITVRLIEGM